MVTILVLLLLLVLVAFVASRLGVDPLVVFIVGVLLVVLFGVSGGIDIR